MVDLVRDILAQITDAPDIATRKALSNCPVSDGNGGRDSVLAHAVRLGLPDAVAVLLAAGASMNPEFGASPWALATLAQQAQDPVQAQAGAQVMQVLQRHADAQRVAAPNVPPSPKNAVPPPPEQQRQQSALSRA